MIRVLHIINGADLGGISTMLLNYYRNLNRKKYHFDFVYSINKPLGHNGIELQKLGAKFFYVPKKSDGLWKHVKGLEKVINSGNYNVIHVHSSLTSYVALAVGKHCGIKIRVAHAHNAVKNVKGIKHKINKVLGNILIRKYATIRLACSKDAANYTFGRKAINERDVKILPNAIDPQVFLFSKDLRIKKRSELGIDESEFVIGSVGRMTEEKNQIFLLEILKEMINIVPKCRLVLVGDGDLKKQIENRADVLGLSKYVLFMGQRTDVPELLNIFDVFVLPSIYEGFPIVGIEAGTNGLPIILSDTITKELKFFSNIQYVSLSEKPIVWAQAIYSFKDTQRNEEALRQIQEKAYDIGSSTKIIEQVYLGELN